MLQDKVSHFYTFSLVLNAETLRVVVGVVKVVKQWKTCAVEWKQRVVRDLKQDDSEIVKFSFILKLFEWKDLWGRPFIKKKYLRSYSMNSRENFCQDLNTLSIIIKQKPTRIGQFSLIYLFYKCFVKYVSDWSPNSL